MRWWIRNVFLSPTINNYKQTFKIIRIFYVCEVQIEKSVRRVIVRHHEAASWCRRVILWNRFFYSHQTPMIDSFSCIPFDFQTLILIITFALMPENTAVRHKILTKQWRCKHINYVNLTTRYVMSYTTNAQTAHDFVFLFLSYPWVKIRWVR